MCKVIENRANNTNKSHKNLKIMRFTCLGVSDRNKKAPHPGVWAMPNRRLRKSLKC